MVTNPAKTLRRLVDARKLPTYRFGTRVLRLKLSDLDSCIFTVDHGKAR